MDDKRLCGVCHRQISTNYDGHLRKHRCWPNVVAHRLVTLRSGGCVTLTLSGPFDALKINEHEAALLACLAAHIRAYESA